MSLRLLSGAGPVLYLQTRIEVRAEHIVIFAVGEVDLETAPALACAIAEGFAKGRRVIAEMSGVRYLDASAIRILSQAATAFGSRFVVVIPAPGIRRLFDILELADTVPIVTSLSAAEEYLRNQ